MAYTQKRSLDALPTELLWRIARHCPAEDCLHLTQVSQSLRRALLDKLVFKEIIVQNRLIAQAEDLYLPIPTRLSLLSRSPRLSKPAIDEYGQLRRISPIFTVERLENLLGNDLQAWIRIAVAESKTYQINKQLPEFAEKPEFCHNAKSLLLRIHKYGTILSALHHPWVYGNLVTTFLIRRLSSINSSTYEGTGLEIEGGNDMLPAFAFNICAAVLSNPRSIGCSHTANTIVAETSVRCEEESEYADSTVTQFALAACVSLLEDHLEGEADSDPQIPRIQDLPWISDIENGIVPLPCAPASCNHKSSRFVTWEEWEADCIYRMTDPDYLEDGQWCGYWSFDGAAVQGIPTVQFADAIEGLVFRVSRLRRSSRHAAPQPIRGSYPNSGDDFHLDGHFTRDGRFTLGPPGDFWVWRGRMTPFGMFGFWGSTDWSRIAGICWLWKKSWSDAAREERLQRKGRKLE
ncbi:MAG: hypothetical protein M1821_008519 [Bathelium mastoideum]|nr:MAG: hypothetical protein M1821_008519 [Bathelium mastoideum]